VPRLVKFSGLLKDASGNLLTNIVGITFAIYSEQSGGAPLWQETQNVQFSQGRYTVFLGESKSTGIPAELFSSGQPRWLGVRALLPDEKEQTRVLLASVPYALKAVDADTLGGLPASAFIQANGGNSSSIVMAPATAAGSGKHSILPPSSTVTTGGGTPGTIPYFKTSTDIENSAIFQSGTGTSAMLGIATTTPYAPLSLVNTGIYIGTTVNDAVSVFLNGYTEPPPAPGSGMMNGISVGGITPSLLSGAVTNVTGISTRMASNCNSQGRTTCNTVGGYFVGEAKGDGAGVWGTNPIAFDDAGSMNTNIVGGEFDIGVYGTPSFVRGLDIILVSNPKSPGTMPLNSTGIEIGTQDSLYYKKAAIEIDQSATIQHAVLIDAISPGPSNSQDIGFVGKDSTGTARTAAINADSTGDLSIDSFRCWKQSNG
jgi:hypothetical protein